jgi:transposase
VYGYDGGKKIKGRKRCRAVNSQGNLLGVQVTGADVSDARGAYAVLDGVLGRYRSVRVVIADKAYDREGLLEWFLGKWEVGLDCVGRCGGRGFVVLSRRWLVERSFAWLLCSGCLSRCWDVLCAVEEAWLWLAGIRRLMRHIAKHGS